MNCLDTYALIEIAKGNPSYSGLFDADFIIADTTLAEFYWVLLRDFEAESCEWRDKLLPYSKEVKKELLLEAMKYRFDNRKRNLSFFDCVGYLFAQANGCNFVTGDKEFKNQKGVLFIK